MTALNARIGRTMTYAQAAARRPPADRRVLWLLVMLLAALWPHAIYVARRTVDGSDEPWGVLALATVITLLWRDRAHLTTPTRSALVASALLAIVAALAELLLPNLAAAAIAMFALGVFLAHALPQRRASSLIVLLLLALPIIASLQFYLGYPLRVFNAHASAALLSLLGYQATADGAALKHHEITVLIDAPCAGIGMLWVGSYTAALLSYLHQADGRATLINAAAAALLVLAANVLRNVALFFPEAGMVEAPAWAHDAVGLAAFGAAIVPLVFIVARRSRTAR